MVKPTNPNGGSPRLKSSVLRGSMVLKNLKSMAISRHLKKGSFGCFPARRLGRGDDISAELLENHRKITSTLEKNGKKISGQHTDLRTPMFLKFPPKNIKASYELSPIRFLRNPEPLVD